MSEYVWSRRGAGTSLILVATCALFHCHASRGVDAPRVEPKPSPPSPAPVAVPKPVPTPMRISVRDPCWEPEPPVPEQGPLALWVRQAGLSDPERYWQAIPFWAKPCLPPSADGMNHHGGCGHGQVTCWQQPCPFLSDLAEDMDAPRAGEDVESGDERFVKGCGQRLPTGTLSGLAALLFGKNGRWMPDAIPADSKVDKTARKLERYASVAFPAWWRGHGDNPCPDAIDQLNHYIGTRDSLDAWGHPIRLVLCGSSMPYGQGGKWGLGDFMLVSAGEDGQFDTLDDLAIAREGE